MTLRKLLSGERGAAALVMERRAARVHVRLGALALSWPLWLAIGIGAAVVARTLAVWAPEGDSALHLKLMQDIAATGTLPSELPHYAARVGAGGDVEAMFPYAYTPLFHSLGAAMYRIAGTPGVALMNGASAFVVAIVIYHLVSRRLPAIVATGSGLIVFVAPTIVSIYTHVYMEPMMLAFVFGGVWYSYLALMTRRRKYAALAGALLGLAVATRQTAVLYVGAIAVVMICYLADRCARDLSRLRREIPWLLAFSAAFVALAAPALGYLAYSSGAIGYGDMTLPGSQPKLAVDAAANAYVAGITKPDVSMLAWLDRYRGTVFYMEQWFPAWTTAILVALMVVGVATMERRGGGGRFLARLVVVQLIAEVTMFAIVHGNGRYIMASRMLCFAAMPVGLYACVQWLRPSLRGRFTTAVVGIAAAAGLAFLLVGGGYGANIKVSQDLMTLRSDAHAEAAAWANRSTPEDSLFLVPRTYTAELEFERDFTWVTFYGNLWVVDAISSPDPARAHSILADHGVDYVLIADPPGTYIDGMPAGGMRSYLQFGREPTRYFELVYVTDDSATIKGREVEHALRIYRVVPVEASAR